VRATELTVSPDGLRAMPAALPATTAYTYCVELSVDEAVAADATQVVFSKSVALYFENYRGFPVGASFPVGWYDRANSVWRPSNDGRVVRIVAIVEGRAYLDVDGDAVQDDADTLIGTTILEREKLATLYGLGQTL